VGGGEVGELGKTIFFQNPGETKKGITCRIKVTLARQGEGGRGEMGGGGGGGGGGGVWDQWKGGKGKKKILCQKEANQKKKTNEWEKRKREGWGGGGLWWGGGGKKERSVCLSLPGGRIKKIGKKTDPTHGNEISSLIV